MTLNYHENYSQHPKICVFLRNPLKNTTNPLLYTKISITYQNFSKLIFFIYQKIMMILFKYFPTTLQGCSQFNYIFLRKIIMDILNIKEELYQNFILLDGKYN